MEEIRKILQKIYDKQSKIPANITSSERYVEIRSGNAYSKAVLDESAEGYYDISSGHKMMHTNHWTNAIRGLSTKNDLDGTALLIFLTWIEQEIDNQLAEENL